MISDKLRNSQPHTNAEQVCWYAICGTSLWPCWSLAFKSMHFKSSASCFADRPGKGSIGMLREAVLHGKRHIYRFSNYRFGKRLAWPAWKFCCRYVLQSPSKFEALGSVRSFMDQIAFKSAAYKVRSLWEQKQAQGSGIEHTSQDAPNKAGDAFDGLAAPKRI